MDLMAEIVRNPDRIASNQSYIDAYDFDNCIECGECLRGCIYKDLSEDQAIENIVKMREGDACIFHSCFACEFGDDYLESIMRLYQQVGFDCVELAHNGENNACCGIGRLL